MESINKKISFTPGPWFQSHVKDSDGMYSTKVYDHLSTIATLDWYPVNLGDGVTGTAREANARLIVEAPTMLSFIERFIALSECNEVTYKELEEARKLIYRIKNG